MPNAFPACVILSSKLSVVPTDTRTPPVSFVILINWLPFHLSLSTVLGSCVQVIDTWVEL